MSITAIVENGTIKLPVHIPDGTRVEITVPAETRQQNDHPTVFDSLREIIGKAEGLPQDFAAEHDHYLHGTPKRDGE